MACSELSSAPQQRWVERYFRSLIVLHQAALSFSVGNRGTGFARRGLTPMHSELIKYMRAHAHGLVRIARKLTDPAASLELETLAVEMLKQAQTLEQEARR